MLVIGGRGLGQFGQNNVLMYKPIQALTMYDILTSNTADWDADERCQKLIPKFYLGRARLPGLA